MGANEIKNHNNLDFFGLAIVVFTFYAFTFFVYSPIVHDSKMLNYALTFIPLLFLIIDIQMSKRKFIISNVTILWTLFCIYMLIRSVISVITLYEAQFILFVIFISFVNSKTDNFRASLFMIKVFAIFYTIGCLFQVAFPSQYQSYILPIFSNSAAKLMSSLARHGKYSGFSYQTGTTATFIAYGIGLIGCQWLLRYKKISVIDIMTFLLMLVALFLTGKREQIALIPLILLLIFLVFRTKKIKSQILIIIFALVFVAFMVYLLSESTISDGRDITSGRILLYKKAFQYFLENPILGIGWGRFKPTTMVLPGVHTDVHNVYLQLLCETGIIGFVLFCLPVFYTYYRTFKAIRKLSNLNSERYVIFLLGYSLFLQTFFILGSFVENTIYSVDSLIFYILPCLMAYSIEIKIKKQQTDISVI